MKFLLAISMMVFFGTAEASYYQNNCANAESTVRWGDGHRETGAFFRDTDDRGQWFTVEFERNQLVIELKNEKLLGKKLEGGEEWSSTQTWYSATATVTPTPEVAEEFKKLFPTGEFKEHVICTKITSW